MKKLLTLSVLAATLASTAVFAQQQMAAPNLDGKVRPGMGTLGDQNVAPFLFVSKKASQPTIEGFKIAQTLINALAGQEIKAKKAVIVFDKDGSPLKANIDLEKALTAKAINALQEAGLGLVRLSNNELGYTGLVAAAGNGKTILTLSAISQAKDDNTVATIAVVIAKDGKGVNIVKDPLNQKDADKLIQAKKAADPAPADGKRKGKR